MRIAEARKRLEAREYRLGECDYGTAGGGRVAIATRKTGIGFPGYMKTGYGPTRSAALVDLVAKVEKQT